MAISSRDQLLSDFQLSLTLKPFFKLTIQLQSVLTLCRILTHVLASWVTTERCYSHPFRQLFGRQTSGTVPAD